jgi:putative transposase
MTLNQSALLELTDVLRTADGGKVMRLMLSAILQALVDAEATTQIGANPYEHTPARTTQRNGTREKTVSTTAGDLMVKIPKLRSGSFFPSLLAPRRRIDVALNAVVMEAYVHGVSTRKVDDLVAALGVDAGISKSEVSRICADLDVEVAVFQGRELTEQAFPYVFVDATYCKARVAGRVVSQAVVITTGVSADGRREVLGSAVGDSETQDFWTEFLRGLRERGLHGVQLVISDHHQDSRHGAKVRAGSGTGFGLGPRDEVDAWSRRQKWRLPTHPRERRQLCSCRIRTPPSQQREEHLA